MGNNIFCAGRDRKFKTTDPETSTYPDPSETLRLLFKSIETMTPSGFPGLLSSYTFERWYHEHPTFGLSLFFWMLKTKTSTTDPPDLIDISTFITSCTKLIKAQTGLHSSISSKTVLQHYYENSFFTYQSNLETVLQIFSLTDLSGLSLSTEAITWKSALKLLKKIMKLFNISYQLHLSPKTELNAVALTILASIRSKYSNNYDQTGNPASITLRKFSYDLEQILPFLNIELQKAFFRK
jgi:hypothetical protein